MPDLIDLRSVGNEAFKAKKFNDAEESYSKALDLVRSCGPDIGDKTNEPVWEGVHLWQLLGNRCAARLGQGKLTEALQDALASNRCAPKDETKPILRCAEALAAMGLHVEMMALLRSASSEFSDSNDVFISKSAALSPSPVIRVGPNHILQSFGQAVAMAPPGSEILVDPGVYDAPLLLTKPITLRCSAIRSDFQAIDNLDSSALDDWTVIRVKDNNAVCCITSGQLPIHLIGFRIECF